MAAELRLVENPLDAVRSSQPLYFISGEQRLFGWLHWPPAEVQADLGVVLCQPFGYEAICAHRGIRVFAESIAAAGMPALRFDYQGTGDSLDIEPQADQIEAWTKDVLAAVETLKSLSGVKQVCLLGFRLGALLATLAAAQNINLTGLVVVSPLASGKRYIRELRTTRMAASLGAHSEPAEKQEPAAGMEVSGFTLSPATLETLAKVDLSALQSSLPQMLIIESSTTSAAGRNANGSNTAGFITRMALPGLVEMLMTAPQFAQAPKAVIKATLDWLLKLVAPNARLPTGSQGRWSNSTSSLIASSLLSLPGTGPGAKYMRTETPVFFGADKALFGVLTQPAAGEIRRRAVILLNAGADHHVGASRLYVSMARRWAQHGYVVLRMDLGGVGDSDTRPGRTDDDVFPKEALDDIRAAIDFLTRGYGIRDVTLAGLCSGAYHALRAAVAGLPVNRILMVNPQNYFWRLGETLQGLQLAEVVHNPGIYRERMYSLAAWKKFFTGQVNIVRIIKIYLQRPLLVLESRLRDVARRLHIRLPNDLGRELEEVVARGVRVSFVFAHGEPGIELLKVQAGNSVKRLANRCRIHILKSGDHVFTRSDARAVMEAVVSDELYAGPESSDEPDNKLNTGGLRFG